MTLNRKPDPASAEPEFAPEYSTKERLRHAAVLVPIGGALLLAAHLWFLPAWNAFAKNSACESVLGVPGTSVVMYGIFVGFPLLAALTLAATPVPGFLRVWRTRRNPPPGEKVYRRTRIKTGRAAIVAASWSFVPAVAFAAIATWGTFAAGDVLAEIQSKRPRTAVCAMPN